MKTNERSNANQNGDSVLNERIALIESVRKLLGGKSALSRRSAAEMIDMSPRTLANLDCKNQGPGKIRMGKGRVFYETEAFLDWYEKRIQIM